MSVKMIRHLDEDRFVPAKAKITVFIAGNSG